MVAKARAAEQRDAALVSCSSILRVAMGPSMSLANCQPAYLLRNGWWPGGGYGAATIQRRRMMRQFAGHGWH